MDMEATVGSLAFPLNSVQRLGSIDCQHRPGWPAHATRQFCHYQCWLSIEPRHPGKPRLSFISRMPFMWASFGSRRYSFPNVCMIAFVNCCTATAIVDSQQDTTSSTASHETPYRRIRIAADTRYSGYCPFLLVASVFCRNSGRIFAASKMRFKTLWGIPRTALAVIALALGARRAPSWAIQAGSVAQSARLRRGRGGGCDGCDGARLSATGAGSMTIL